MIYLDPSHCRYEQTTQTFYCNVPWNDQCHRYRAWKSGCVPEVMQDGIWRYAPDEAVLPLLLADLAGHEAQHPVALYAAQIPQEIASVVQHYEIDQMVMLHLCASSQRAVQLLRHSPNFLWLIGPFVAQASQGQPQIIHDILGCSQKKLLGIAFGTATQSMVNMLKKIPLGTISDERFCFLQALSDTTCSAVLRHRQTCPWPLFKIIIRYGDLLQYPFARRLFLEKLSLEELQCNLSAVVKVYIDTVRLGRVLRIENSSRFVAGCESLYALRLLHERWIHRLNNEQEAQSLARLAKPFPSPPVPGTADIIPLDTECKLLTEGRTMHHCVGGYGSTVRAGASYIYQVWKPERATLELRLAQNGTWRIAQIKASCNAEVSSKTRNFLQGWLIKAQREDNARTRVGGTRGQKMESGRQTV